MTKIAQPSLLRPPSGYAQASRPSKAALASLGFALIAGLTAVGSLLWTRASDAALLCSTAMSAIALLYSSAMLLRVRGSRGALLGQTVAWFALLFSLLCLVCLAVVWLYTVLYRFPVASDL